MDLYQRVFENNQKYVEQRLQEDPEYFKDMAMGQSPDFLYIGCSDSRVQPETFLGVRPGEVFVHRNIANLIPNNDVNSMAVVQYAVENLKVKNIIICGHYGCGGVEAAMTRNKFNTLGVWLRNIKDVRRIHKDELMAIENETERFNRLVELNVREQCLNVMKFSFVQRAQAETGYPRVHGWVYDLKQGTIKDMNISPDSLKDDLDTYLYNLDGEPERIV